VTVEPVQDGQVTEGLRREPGIAVDIGKTGQPPCLGGRQVGVEDKGIGGDQMEQTPDVRHPDCAKDAGEGYDVR